MSAPFHSSNKISWTAMETCNSSESQKIQSVSVCWRSL